MNWTGQHLDVKTAADNNGCVMHKQRKSYIFCGFNSSQARTAFKAALGSVSGISFQDWVYDNDPNLFVVKVVPA